MEKPDIKLNIHPIFEIIEDSFMFFMVSQNMLAIPSFQEALVKIHDGKMSQFQTSVAFEGDSALKFDVAYALNRFNKVTGMKEVNGNVEGNIGALYIQHGRLLSIAIFNILESSKYCSKIDRNIFDFSRHLRNGSAHGNKFNFNGYELERMKQASVQWRGKKISHTLQGKKLFGNFIFLPDLMILMYDISEELYRIDGKLK